ncbi:MAG: threonylcarbamoyl-AMP synthase [Clostridia bacterium]|nr:threonylcarbamoyl-AMP synthase [Clostridia bacterium]
METKVLIPTDENIEYAGKLLAGGELVGIPTETVYGLAANALDGQAVGKIFAAKGRPADNPLIVHISDISQIEKFRLVREIPDTAKKLMDAFFPGPLTIIMKKGSVPDEVTAGLDTVAVRFPSHPITKKIITAAGVPLAAPSANTSGKPSPTTAGHVFHDLNGKIPCIIDGGACRVGVESTVITVAGDLPTLLRPGGITLEQLNRCIGRVDVAKAVIDKLANGETAQSPGMKYKHYAPAAKIVLIKASDEKYAEFVNASGAAALCYDEDVENITVCAYTLGKKNDVDEQLGRLFGVLREIDSDCVPLVYGRCPETSGKSLAMYNRLIRAAGFEVKTLA